MPLATVSVLNVPLATPGLVTNGALGTLNAPNVPFAALNRPWPGQTTLTEPCGVVGLSL